MTFASKYRGADTSDRRCRGRMFRQSLPGTPAPPQGNRNMTILLYIRRPVALCFLFLFTATPIVSLQTSVTSSLFTPRFSGTLRCIHNGGLQPKRRFIRATLTGIFVRPNTIPDATSKVASGSSSSVATTATNEGESDVSVMTVDPPPKEGFDVLSTLHCLEVDMQRERMMHALACAHFKALYDWFLFLPSILLSLLGGLVAFVSKSDKPVDVTATASLTFDEGIISFFAANGVGIVSLLSVFWQSLSKQLNLGGRAMLHESAAIAIKRLLEDLPFKSLDPDFNEEETDAYLKTLNDKFHQAVNGCNSPIPIRVSSAYYLLQSDLDLHLKLYNNNVLREFGLKREELYFAAFSELFVTFSNFGGWPFIFPRSRYAVDTAVSNLFDKFKDARGEDTKG